MDVRQRAARCLDDRRRDRVLLGVLNALGALNGRPGPTRRGSNVARCFAMS
jgi:hypothetical protein